MVSGLNEKRSGEVDKITSMKFWGFRRPSKGCLSEGNSEKVAHDKGEGEPERMNPCSIVSNGSLPCPFWGPSQVNSLYVARSAYLFFSALCAQTARTMLLCGSYWGVVFSCVLQTYTPFPIYPLVLAGVWNFTPDMSQEYNQYLIGESCIKSFHEFTNAWTGGSASS